jgi:lysophospholipase L1-like esterase
MKTLIRLFTVSLLLSGLILPLVPLDFNILPVWADASANYSIAFSDCDAMERIDTGVVDLTLDPLTLSSTTSYYSHVGLYTRDIHLSSGMTFTDNCYIQFYANTETYDDPDMNIYLHDAANTTPFATATNNISGRSRTDNITYYQATGVGIGWVGSANTTSIKNQLQELVDTYGEVNGISIILEEVTGGSGHRFTFRSWNYGDHSLAPRIFIEYTGGVTTPEPASNFISTANNTDSMSFSWATSPDADYYEVRWSHTENASDNQTGKLGYWGSGTSCTIPVAANLTYNASLFTHKYDGGWATSDTVLTATATTPVRESYPEYPANDGATYQVVFFGDSGSVTPGGFFGDLTGYSCDTSAAHGGYTSDNLTPLYDSEVASENPVIISILMGANDIFNDLTEENWLANYTEVLDKAQASENISLVIVQAISPGTYYTDAKSVKRNQWNDDLETLAGNYSKAVFIETDPYVGQRNTNVSTNNMDDMLAIYDSGDGIHFNDAGYLVITRALTTALTESSAPDAPTGFSATDGTNTSSVNCTWTLSISDNVTGQLLFRDGVQIADLGPDVDHYEDTGADAGTITAGTATASNGSSNDYVTLSLAGESTDNGTSHTYKISAYNDEGASANATDTGYRGVGSITYQWQRSAADSAASFSNLIGATTDPYNDTTALATGDGRYYQCYVSATGAVSQTSTSDRGFRGAPPVLASIGNQSVTVNTTLSFTISATGIGTISYGVLNNPAGSTLNSETGAFSWTPDTVGTYTGVSFNAANEYGSDIETITITVNNPVTPSTASGTSLWIIQILVPAAIAIAGIVVVFFFKGNWIVLLTTIVFVICAIVIVNTLAGVAG